MEQKIYAEMSNLKVVYFGERSGISKASGKPYVLKQAQLEQTTRNGMKSLHIMTVPNFNLTPLVVGDTINAHVAIKAGGNAVYMDLTEHSVVSDAKLKSVAGGAK